MSFSGSRDSPEYLGSKKHVLKNCLRFISLCHLPSAIRYRHTNLLRNACHRIGSNMELLRLESCQVRVVQIFTLSAQTPPHLLVQWSDRDCSTYAQIKDGSNEVVCCDIKSSFAAVTTCLFVVSTCLICHIAPPSQDRLKSRKLHHLLRRLLQTSHRRYCFFA